MNIQDLQYAFPEAAYLIPAIFLIAGLFWMLFEYRQKQLTSFTSPTLLQTLYKERLSSIYWIKVVVLCIAWILLSIALMQPQGYGNYPFELTQSQTITKKQPNHDIYLFVDASASMSVSDLSEGKTRLEYAKEIGDLLVSRLKGQRIALNAFTSKVTVLSPLTTDYLFVRLMLRNLTVNEGGIPGTDLIQAFKQFNEHLSSQTKGSKKSLILLTDGGDTEIESIQGDAKKNAISNLLNQLKETSNQHVDLYFIGIGTQTGGEIPKIEYEGKPVHSNLDDTLLQQMTQSSKGHYFKAEQQSPLELAAALSELLNGPTRSEVSQQVTEETSMIHTLYFQWPLGIALLLLLFYFYVPESARSTKLLKETTNY